MKKLLLLTLILISGGVLYSQTLPAPYGNTRLKMSNGDTTWIATLSQLTGFFGSGGTVTEIITGAGLTGGPIATTGTIQVSTNGIANNMLRQSVGLSVIGRSPNTTGDVADITAGIDKQVLRRDGTSIGFGAIDIASSNAVTGVLPVANGGTGQTTFTDGQLLIGNTTGNTLTKATLTAGTGISITNGAGAITIGATYGSIPLTNGNIFVGNASNVATSTSVAGDISISNTGVTAIAAGVIENADIATNANIERTKLLSGTANHVLINNATGVMSSEAQLQPSRGGTGESTLIAARRVLDGFTTIATAGGTTTLSATTSSYNQVFTGTQNQTITLPATSALSTGGGYLIVNNSTGTLTVQTSASATLGTIPSGTSARVMVLNTATNTVADWEFAYAEFMSLTGTGSTVVLQSSPRIVNPTLAGVTYSTAASFTADANSQTSVNMPDSAVINITLSNAAPGGATLPVAAAGKTVIVYNNTSNSRTVNIYPRSGATIDGLGTNNPIAIPPQGVISFTATSATQWYSTVRNVTNLSFSTGSLSVSQLSGTLPAANGGTGLSSTGAVNTILGVPTTNTLGYFVLTTANEQAAVQVRRELDLGDTDSLVINIPDASTSFRGLVTIGDQTFGGNKTFNGFISAAGSLSATNFISNPAISINGAVSNKVTTITSNTTLDFSHNIIRANNSAEIIITLPLCGGFQDGITYNIHKVSDNNFAVIIARQGSNTFEGGATNKYLINRGTDATCICNSTTGTWIYSSL